MGYAEESVGYRAKVWRRDEVWLSALLTRHGVRLLATRQPLSVIFHPSSSRANTIYHIKQIPNNQTNNMCGSDIFLGFLAILFPPLAGESRARIPSPHDPRSHQCSMGQIGRHQLWRYQSLTTCSMGQVRSLLCRLAHQHRS
jgi:hypothetical protein